MIIKTFQQRVVVILSTSKAIICNMNHFRKEIYRMKIFVSENMNDILKQKLFERNACMKFATKCQTLH
jgi:hypothetical protein